MSSEIVKIFASRYHRSTGNSCVSPLPPRIWIACSVTPVGAPRAPQHVTAADLVIQRVEPTSGIGLGRPVQRMLQGTDRIGRNAPARSRSGGTSHNGTHRAPPSQHCAPTKQRPFPSPAVLLSAWLNRYYGRLRRPPGQQSTSRREPVIGRHAPAAAQPQATGPGRASPVPAATLDTFRAPYAGESLTAALPGSTPLPWPSP